jgi:hypothetical protein
MRDGLIGWQMRSLVSNVSSYGTGAVRARADRGLPLWGWPPNCSLIWRLTPWGASPALQDIHTFTSTPPLATHGPGRVGCHQQPANGSAHPHHTGQGTLSRASNRPSSASAPLDDETASPAWPSSIHAPRVMKTREAVSTTMRPLVQPQQLTPNRPRSRKRSHSRAYHGPVRLSTHGTSWPALQP